MPADDASRAAARLPAGAGPAGPEHAAIARAIIRANRYMTLATAGEDGRPWASPVFYAAAGDAEFYWISAPEATHSRNIAQRPRLSIVIFDSTAAEGAGQAVYMSATAGRVADRDIARGLAVFPGAGEPRAGEPGAGEPRAGEPGAPELTAGHLQGAAPYRLYRATVGEHWILCPRGGGRGTGPCAQHGLEFDHRVPVRLARPR